MIRSDTPFRVSLFGGGTDFPDWSVDHGGRVLSFAINHFCHIFIRYFPPFFEERFRIVYSNIELTQEVGAIKHPVVKAVFERFGASAPLELIHHGDLPAQSGLGSSSAFTVGLIAAYGALLGRDLTSHEVALEAVTVEREVLAESGGLQDQVAVATGGINEITFSGDSWRVLPIDLTSDEMQELEQHMVLVFSGVKRRSADLSGEVTRNLGGKTKAFNRLAQIAYEASQLLRRGDYTQEFGELMKESRNLKLILNPQSESPRIRELLDAGMESGALGGKVLGAGGGGFVLFWIEPRQRASFLRQFGHGVQVPFRIEQRGVRIDEYGLQPIVRGRLM